MSAGFDECFHEHYPRLVAFAVATTGDREAGRELAQEAFARLHANWSRISTYDQPGAWLRRVVANLAIDRHRSQRSERRALERVAVVAAPAEPELGADTWTQLVAVLPPRQRAIVTLHFTDDIVVVARMCDGTRTLHVEAVSLDSNQLLWSNSVDWLEADSYSSTAGLSARIDGDGEIVALVTAGGGVEEPNRAVVFTADAAAEITRLGYARYAFSLDEL